MDQFDNLLEKRITEAFMIFDLLGNKTIDIREVGTVLRFLGCVPTEAQINEIILATEETDNKGYITLKAFVTYVSEYITERKMEPATSEKLLEAFQVLDEENRGYLTKEFISKVMIEEGEPFAEEELEEMLAVAIDHKTGHIPYEYYLNQLLYNPKESIFDIAQIVKKEKERLKALQQKKQKKPLKIPQS